MPTHVTELAIKGKDQTHPLHINNIDHTNKATRSQLAGANYTTKQGETLTKFLYHLYELTIIKLLLGFNLGCLYTKITEKNKQTSFFLSSQPTTQACLFLPGKCAHFT